MPTVIIRSTLGLSGTHGQDRLAPIEGLDLRFLIDAQNQRFVGRVEVQTHNVAHLVDEQWVTRDLESLATVGLECKSSPDPTDRGLTHPRGLRH